MTIRIDHQLATQILYTESESAKHLEDAISRAWADRIAHLSELCPYRKSSTFIAALGTALLAKSVNPAVDVYCLLDREGESTSYSARSLADNVWAKHRAYIDVDLGANGANPLNNTPFIGKTRIDDIKQGVRNKSGYAYLEQCLDLLASYHTVAEARAALRGFISSRRVTFVSAFNPGEHSGDHFVIPTLCSAITTFVDNNSEEGRRAQAVASGLLMLAFGIDAVDVGHVNDPDRNFPLDIAVYQQHDLERKISFVVEVKDKPVDGSAIIASVNKALEVGVTWIIYLAVSRRQSKSEFVFEHERARDMGCTLFVYTDWEPFVKATLSFTSHVPHGFARAYQLIGQN